MHARSRFIAALPLLLVCAGCGSPPFPAERLTSFIEHHVKDKDLPGVAVVVVDDQRVVYANGFGEATAESVMRVGSVSKLYTDMAVMQFVEQKKLDLDAPVSRYLPGFSPRNPFGRAVTLRHLMAHRSGLVREPPVGSYFDDSSPSIAAIVESLHNTDAIFKPGSKTKYSNAALVAIGAVVEQTAGVPFGRHMRLSVLEPLGMRSSSFSRLPEFEPRIPPALMWSYDREFPAPTFDVLVPAGNLYSTVLDQAKLMHAIFRGGDPVLTPASLAAMMEPQFDPGARFGLGFVLSEFEGRRRIGHGGAVYGFSTSFAALPEEKIGVIVSASRDFTNGVVQLMEDDALGVALAWKEGHSPQPSNPPQPLKAAERERAAGLYASEKLTIRLVDRSDDLWIDGMPYQRVPIRRGSLGLVTDGALVPGIPVRLEEAAVVIGDVRYQTVPDTVPPPPPVPWNALIGEYGWDHNILFILERYGQLCALVEWLPMYPLTLQKDGSWAFPGHGLYHDEAIRFERDEKGRVAAAIMAGVRFPRRATASSGATFRITPLQPVAELRKAAERAQPPPPTSALDPDLVDLEALGAGFRFDIRYATANNFMGARFYPAARALLQPPAAEALVRVHRALASRGYGLLIHDAYRPWYVTKMFWDATPASMKHFVANPQTGSIHNRGAAVDLALFDLTTGRPVEMPSGYDEFSARAHPGYPGGTSRQRWLRDLLRGAMEAEGFSVYEHEWWHFNYRGAGGYPILNISIEGAGR